MSAPQDLIQRALNLSEDDRADLAERLLLSLDEPIVDQAEIDRAWAREIERRADEVLSGKAKTIPAEEVFRRVQSLTRK